MTPLGTLGGVQVTLRALKSKAAPVTPVGASGAKTIGGGGDRYTYY